MRHSEQPGADTHAQNLQCLAGRLETQKIGAIGTTFTNAGALRDAGTRDAGSTLAAT